MNKNWNLPLLEKTLAERPDDMEALYQMGLYHEEQEDFKLAASYFEQLLKLSHSFQPARFHLGMVYSRQADWNTAISVWLKMRDEDEDLTLKYVEAESEDFIAVTTKSWEKFCGSPSRTAFQYFMAGIAFYILGNPQKAVSEIIEGLHRDPQIENAWLYLGLAHLKTKNYEEALAAFRNEAKTGETPSLNYHLALALYESGQKQQAFQYLKKVLEKKPNYIKATYLIGTTANDLENLEKAEEYLTQSTHQAPSWALPYLELGKIYEKQFKMEKAQEKYETALKLAPDVKETHFRLGLLKKTMGKSHEALEHFQKVLELDPSDGEVYYYSGLLFTQMGKYPEAIEQLKKAVEIIPNHSYANYALGSALVASDQPAQAIPYFEKAWQLNPTDTRLRLALGEAYIRMGEAYKAIDEFRKLLKLNPYDFYTRYYLGIAHLRLGELEPAMEQFEEIIKRKPGSIYAHFSMGAAYIYKEEFEKAAQEFEKAGELLPSSEKDLELFSTLQLLAAIGIEYAKAGAKIRELYQHLNDAYIDTVKALAQTIDARDKYTKFHSSRVATISAVLAQAMGLSKEDADAVEIAGYLHDVGKIGISDQILLKESSLNPEEQELIRTHPVIGFNILKDVRFPWDILPLIKYHHEKYDGTGYPEGLKAEEIPIGSQIIHLADYFDAIITKRPYHEAISTEDALTELESKRGINFNPELLNLFLKELDTINNLLNNDEGEAAI